MPRHVLPPSQEAGAPRFALHGQDMVEDAATGLFWPRSANILGYPLTWGEALAAVAEMNREAVLGRADWRLPNRRELRSLVDHGQKQPALPAAHPFLDVFLGWYWTSTTKAGQSAYAWNVHFEGGRMFYSRKDEFRLLWPVCGQSTLLPQTGQRSCFGAAGELLACAGTGQDGELQAGAAWPAPRFEAVAQGILDHLTGLCWQNPAGLAWHNQTWEEAQALAKDGWRLPNINELESLVDAERADPALPEFLAAAAPKPERKPNAEDGFANEAAPGPAGSRQRLSPLEGATPGGISDRTDRQSETRPRGSALVDSEARRSASAESEDMSSAPGNVGHGNVWPEGFWSGTASGFDPAWAFVLYVRKGAVGVGFKAGREFPAWLVRAADEG